MKCFRLLALISAFLLINLFLPLSALADSVPCLHCDGTGHVFVYSDCSHCSDGSVVLSDGSLTSCPYCSGGGWVLSRIDCPACFGSGSVEEDATFSNILEHLESLEESYSHTNQSQSETFSSSHNEVIGRFDALISEVHSSNSDIVQAVGSSACDYEFEGERTTAVFGLGVFLLGFVGFVVVGLFFVTSLYRKSSSVVGDE